MVWNNNLPQHTSWFREVAVPLIIVEFLANLDAQQRDFELLVHYLKRDTLAFQVITQMVSKLASRVGCGAVNSLSLTSLYTW